MTAFFRSLRKWLQWRADQSRFHVSGVAEHTSVGTIVARDEQQWTIEDDQGRFVYVPVGQFTVATNLQVGNRVEIQPTPQGSPVLRPFNWMIIRKLS
jgi:hypothetical protein